MAPHPLLIIVDNSINVCRFVCPLIALTISFLFVGKTAEREPHYYLQNLRFMKQPLLISLAYSPVRLS